MGSLNPDNPNPNPLVYDETLGSFENLSLNDNSLGSNAAQWHSTTWAPSANTRPCNNFTGAGSYYGGFSSSASNSWNQSDGRSQNDCYNVVMNNDNNSLYTARNQFANLPPMGMTRNSHLNGPWNQNAAQYCSYTRPRNIVVETAKTRIGSLHLQRILKEGNPNARQQIFDEIRGSIFEVMANEYGHHLFQRLLEVCNPRQFDVILVTVASNKNLFIDVALQKHGSTAVQALIKKLKRSDLGYTITAILSQRFVELMTGEQGRYVVQQCFNTFKPKENAVLYDAAVHYFRELATSEYGCASLNACLSCISGVRRVKLLDQIAEHSDFLSNDPWGHFVVQHVLMLRDENITQIICIRLERQYLHLAQRKGGSHVVEKCIRSSEFGMKSVVGTLLQSEKALLQLASDQFGNYVVQTALKVTKHDNVELYGSLLMVLKTRNSVLSRNVIGRHVVSLIKELEGSTVENGSHV